MTGLKVGDIVARKSYGGDVLFKVIDIQNNGKENVITLKGITYRLQADAPEFDLMSPPEQKIKEHRQRCCDEASRKLREILDRDEWRSLKKAKMRNTSKDNAVKFPMPGRILHIDGDSDYLDNCMEQYEKLNLNAVGKYVPEKEQASKIAGFLSSYKPDILVLTGHDGMIKGESGYMNLDNYRNSRFFLEAVKEARAFQSDLDGLVIFAGACHSFYNSLINAGANFASSPYRVMIRAMDPLLVARKISMTNITKFLDPMDVINSTITGVEGIGGVQTRGKYRDGFPLEPFT